MLSRRSPEEREHFVSDFLPGICPSPEDVQKQLQRIKQSEAFVRSARIKRLLDYLVGSALNGQEDRLKESVIGVEVFDRPSDYDPKTDPIVRVEMRRVRSKLSEYYLNQGFDDPVLIWLDKGSYVPVLRSKVAASPPSPSAAQANENKLEPQSLLEPEILPAGQKSLPKISRFSLAYQIGLIVVGALALLAGVAAWRHFSPRGPEGSRSLALLPLTGNAGLEQAPTFSPDGKQVAYSWDGNRQNFDIYVKALGEAGPRRLTDNAGHDLHPAWSPDGKRIVFSRILPNESQLVVVPASGGIETIVSRNAPSLNQWHPDQPENLNSHGPVWSPDGSYFLIAGCVSGTACGLTKVNLDGRQEVFTRPSRGADDSQPVISPSGREVAFVRTLAVRSNDIFVMSAKGGEPVRLTSAYRDIAGLTWLDDNNLVYSSNWGGNYRLWRIDRKGGEPHALPVNGAQPQWPAFSSDGRWMAFVDPAEDSDIWKLSFYGSQVGQAEPFISSAASDDSPAFSPHGDRVVFVSNRTGTPQLWLSDRDGTNIRQLTKFEGSTVGTPRWSPDNRRIVFDASLHDQSSVWLIDSDGSNLHRLNESKSSHLIPSWSRDGRWIYFVTSLDGRDGLYKQRVDTGELVRVADGVYFDAVEYPAGNVILAELRNGGIWQIPLTGRGKPIPLAELRGTRMFRSWTLAGDYLYFVRQEDAPRELNQLNLITHDLRKLTDLPSESYTGTPILAVDSSSNTVLFVQKTKHRSAITLQERQP